MSIKREIGFLCRGEHGDPYRVLGLHATDGGACVRAFFPEAKEAWVIHESPGGEKAYPMKRVYRIGFFDAIIKGVKLPFRYRIRVLTQDGEVREFYDPYAFIPEILTDFDIHLLAEGNHHRVYEKLGGRVAEVGGVKGVYFGVWAPNASRVSVIGDFNSWDGRRHPMRLIPEAGVWEIFIPGLDEGTLYKFEVKRSLNNYLEQKVDPYGLFFEVRPSSASIVYSLEGKHDWKDNEWMKERAEKNSFQAPLSIYELHLGSWLRRSEEINGDYGYRELADRIIPYVKEAGFTHIEFLPLAEHPLDASWGYQVIGFFAPTSRFGRPEDFMYFVDQCHQNGIGVILDWVPSHFPKDGHGLRLFDGTALYEHDDPRKGEHKEWGTLVFNYGRNEVRNFLIANAIFWLEKYHIDGLRVDAVASMLYLDYGRHEGEWIPNRYGGRENLEAIEFLREFNRVVHGYLPGILTIAEESTAWPGVTLPTHLGGLGFSMKWNMGWMHDTLKYFSKDPVFRKFHTYDLTFSLIYAHSENFILSFSHDEVVYGKRSMLNKMPGDQWQQFANLRALYGYMYGHPGKKLLFMGSEFGQSSEWTFFRSLEWDELKNPFNTKLLTFMKDLNGLYMREAALSERDFEHEGFEWIDFHDHESCVFSFIRKAKDPKDFLVFVLNLTPVPRQGYRIGVPAGGFYREILNSDSELYGGSNMGNAGGRYADAMPGHGRPFSLSLILPPLSVLILRPERPGEKENTHTGEGL